MAKVILNATIKPETMDFIDKEIKSGNYRSRGEAIESAMVLLMAKKTKKETKAL